MNTRQKIRQLYRAEPNISSQEIIRRLNIKPTPNFWKILTEEQVNIRGIYSGKRHNSHAHNRVRGKGISRFIPPENKE